MWTMQAFALIPKSPKIPSVSEQLDPYVLIVIIFNAVVEAEDNVAEDAKGAGLIDSVSAVSRSET